MRVYYHFTYKRKIEGIKILFDISLKWQDPAGEGIFPFHV